MKILVACEYSGIVSQAFRDKGHYVLSCDLLQTENIDGRQFHYIGDVRDVLYRFTWDIIIAHPPCTDLASIGAADWGWKRSQGIQQRAIEFFMTLYNAPATIGVCVENPVGIMSTEFRRPDQYVHPWWFGDPYIKRTGLWLRGLPPLVPAVYTPPDPSALRYYVDGQRGRAARDRDNPAFKTSGKERSHVRSKFFPGIAHAMAEQWGNV